MWSMSKAEYGHNAGNEVAKGTALSKRTKSKTVMGMIAQLADGK